MGRPIHLVRLTEISLLPTLWRAAWGEKQVLVDARLAVPGIRGLVRAVARGLSACGRLTAAKDFDSVFAHLLADPGGERTAGIFRTIEPWFNAVRRFECADRTLDVYAGTYKHAACNEVAQDLSLVPAIAHLRAAGSEVRIVLHGFDALAERLPEVCVQPSPPVPEGAWQENAGRGAFRFFNFVMSLGMAGFGLGWIAARTRLWLAPPQRTALGADFLFGGHHLQILRHLRQQSVPLLVVFRSRFDQGRADPVWLNEFEHCHIGSGRFTVLSGFASWIRLVDDTRRFLAHFGDLPPHLFKVCLAAVLYRVKVAGLLRQYRFERFLGRDDYNPEHLLRSALFRKAGIVSYGLNHGLPVPEGVQAVWRYIDFDHYFVFGRDLYERYYRETWSKSIEVHAVGSFGMTAERLQKVDGPRTRDVLFFFNLTSDIGAFIEKAARLAELLPDRHIWLRPKRSRKQEGQYDEIFSRLVHRYENLAEMEGDTFDVLLEHGYAVTNPGTTVAAEAIQFGVKTFVLDNPVIACSYYREFEGLCRNSPEDVAERIRAIERGDAHYDFSRFSGLVALDRRDPYEYLAVVMGVDAAPTDETRGREERLIHANR